MSMPFIVLREIQFTEPALNNSSHHTEQGTALYTFISKQHSYQIPSRVHQVAPQRILYAA